MYVMGQKQPKPRRQIMSALPPKPDVKGEKADIGDFMSAFDPIMSVITPKADILTGPVDVRY